MCRTVSYSQIPHCPQSILPTIYTAHNLYCPQSILPTIYTVYNLHCLQSTLSTINTAHNLYCPQFILPTMYIAHNIDYIFSLDTVFLSRRDAYLIQTISTLSMDECENDHSVSRKYLFKNLPKTCFPGTTCT